MRISGDKIKIARKRLGLSRASLAEQIGVSPRSVEAWEHGRYLLKNIDTVVKLARTLAMDPEELSEETAGRTGILCGPSCISPGTAHEPQTDGFSSGTPHGAQTSRSSHGMPHGAQTDCPSHGTPHGAQTSRSSHGTPHGAQTDHSSNGTPHGAQTDHSSNGTPHGAQTDHSSHGTPHGAQTDHSSNGTAHGLEEVVFAQCVRRLYQRYGLEALLHLFECSLQKSYQADFFPAQDLIPENTWEQMLLLMQSGSGNRGGLDVTRSGNRREPRQELDGSCTENSQEPLPEPKEPGCVTADLPSLYRDARKASGLTQAELAHLAGIDQAAVSRLESGTRIPSLPFLEKLANVLHKELYITLR